MEKLGSCSAYNSKSDNSTETNSQESFDYNFYNYRMDKSGKKITNKDENYYAIEAYDENGNKIKVYTARFFGGSDIEKMIKAFGIDTVKKIQ